MVTCWNASQVKWVLGLCLTWVDGVCVMEAVLITVFFPTQLPDPWPSWDGGCAESAKGTPGSEDASQSCTGENKGFPHVCRGNTWMGEVLWLTVAISLPSRAVTWRGVDSSSLVAPSLWARLESVRLESAPRTEDAEVSFTFVDFLGALFLKEGTLTRGLEGGAGKDERNLLFFFLFSSLSRVFWISKLYHRSKIQWCRIKIFRSAVN